MVCPRSLEVVRGDPDARVRRFTAMAVEGSDERAVYELGERIARDARSTWAAAARCLAVTQRLPYRPDPAGSDDYVAWPCHALRIGGDCEDLSILLAALWSSAGIRCRIRWLTQTRTDQDHVTAQALVGGKWLWGESTVFGAELGEDPYDAAARLGVSNHGSL